MGCCQSTGLLDLERQQLSRNILDISHENEDQENEKQKDQQRQLSQKRHIQVLRKVLEENYFLENLEQSVDEQWEKQIKIVSFLGVHKISGQKYIIRRIEKDKIDSLEIEGLKKELKVLRKLDHPNIIHTYEFYEDQNYISIVQEYIENGDLWNYWSRMSVNKSQNSQEKHKETSKHILFQILKAINHCHQNKIVHRNINPSNILFNLRNGLQVENFDRLLKSLEKDESLEKLENWNYVIRLIDFGQSSCIHDGYQLHKIVGDNHNYMAPEILDKEYNEKCDVWSIGVIAFMMLTGKEPFSDKYQYNILKNVKNLQIDFEEYSMIKKDQESKQFLQKILERNIEKRFSALEAIQSEFFATVRKQIIKNVQENQLLKKAFQKLQEFKKEFVFQNSIIMFMNDRIIPFEEKIDDLKTFEYLDSFCEFKGILDIQIISNQFRLILGKKTPQEIKKKWFQEKLLFLTQDKINGKNNNKEFLKYNEFRESQINKKNLQKKKNQSNSSIEELILFSDSSEIQEEDPIDFVFEKLDLRKKNQINYSEWMMFILDRKKFLQNEYLKKTFDLLDTDQSGTLGLNQIKNLFDSINCSETIRQIWQQNLTLSKFQNQTIFITYPEFEQMMKNNSINIQPENNNSIQINSILSTLSQDSYTLTQTPQILNNSSLFNPKFNFETNQLPPNQIQQFNIQNHSYQDPPTRLCCQI